MTDADTLAATQSEAPGDPARSRAWLLAACAVLAVGLALSAVGAVVWRSGEQQRERSALRATASDVTDSLGTLLRRDGDFVSTLNGVLTMQPHLSPTGFNAWYTTLQGRQVGGVGSAVVQSVPAAQLNGFEARRDADPAFRALMGGWLTGIRVVVRLITACSPRAASCFR